MPHPKFHPPEECPVCGAAVPPRALACPECGADERTGWNEEATRYDGLDLPDESLDTDKFLRDEGLKRRWVPHGIPLYWWLFGAVVVVILILQVFFMGL